MLTSGMAFTVEYYNDNVLRTIEEWPSGILADYLRLVELLMEFGPDLRLPHSRALGGGLFELRARGREGAGRAFFCFIVDRRVVILHAIRKQTRSLPKKELEIAQSRMNVVKK